MRSKNAAGLLLALSIVVAGCAGTPPSGSGAAAPAGPALAAPPASVPGCGAAAVTDLTKIWPRAVAHCDPGTPAAQPLPGREKVTIAIPSKAQEYAAPLVWAQAAGEFDKENLDVDIQVMPSANGLQLTSNGTIDATWSAISASFFNAVHDGFDIRWALGAFYPSSDAKEGLWARTDRATGLADLKGKKIASLVGQGSSVAYIIDNTLNKVGLSINDVELEQYDAPSMVTALEQGAVDAAFLQAPSWLEVADDPAYAFLGSDWQGEPLTGPVFGSRLLRDRPEVGAAFIRAIVRTYSTYFQGSYESDHVFVEKLAVAMGVPAESILKTPQLVWDPEIRQRTVQSMQELFKATGVIQFDGLVPDDGFVDRSFYENVTGAPGAPAS